MAHEKPLEGGAETGQEDGDRSLLGFSVSLGAIALACCLCGVVAVLLSR